MSTAEQYQEPRFGDQDAHRWQVEAGADLVEAVNATLQEDDHD